MSEALFVVAVPIAVFAVAGAAVGARALGAARELARQGGGDRAVVVLVGGLLWAVGLGAAPWLGGALVAYVRTLPEGCGDAWRDHPVRVGVASVALANVLGAARAVGVAVLALPARRP